MGIASGKQHRPLEQSRHIAPMPWTLTGFVSVGLAGLSGFWITVVISGWATAESVPLIDRCWDIAGIVLALTHVGLHAVAVFMRRQWAVSTVVVFLALEGWLLSIACLAFEPAIILIGLAAMTFALCFAMCYWRYKAFNYPSLFKLLDLFEKR